MNTPQMREQYSAAVRHELERLVERTPYVEKGTRAEPAKVRLGAIQRDRVVPAIATAVVLALVVISAVVVTNLHLLGSLTPATTQSSAPLVLPTAAGRVVAMMSNDTGRAQTFRLNTSGSAFQLSWACTGSGGLRIDLAQKGASASDCGRGVTVAGETVDANTGIVPIRVTATGSSIRWILRISTTEPTARDYVYTPAP